MLAQALEDSQVWAVFTRWEASDVHDVSARLDRAGRRALATVANTSEGTLFQSSGIAGTIRRRLRADPRRAPEAAALLVRPIQAHVVAALGDERAEHPTVDDLLEVLPASVAEYGVRAVALLLAVAIDEQWPAAAACSQILGGDERFALDALGAVVDDDAASLSATRRPPAPATSPRESTRQKKPKRKQQASAPARYRKAKNNAAVGKVTTPPSDDADHGREQPDDHGRAGITLNGMAIERSAQLRRPVRIVRSFPALDHHDELVGRVVLADIEFAGPIPGHKQRPCVVIAASGSRHLVVRACYSEGGRRAGDFRAVRITDPESAGLDKESYVDHDEVLIERSAVRREFGCLADPDWNQL